MNVGLLQISFMSLADIYSMTLEKIYNNSRKNIDLLICPELSVNMLPKTKEEAISLAKKYWEELPSFSLKLKEINACPILIGIPVCLDNNYSSVYSAAILVYNGTFSVVSTKKNVCSKVFKSYSENIFSSGSGSRCLTINGKNILVALGADILDCTSDIKINDNVDLVVNLTSVFYSKGIDNIYLDELKRVSSYYNSPLASVNLVGGYNELVFYGSSKAITENGICCYNGPVGVSYSDCLFNCEIDIIKDELELLWEVLVLGTRDYIIKNGFKNVVLGLSGGIDSALVAAIACSAIGSSSVHGILMPSLYSSDSSVADSMLLAKSLNISTSILPIAPSVNIVEESFKSTFSKDLTGLAAENIQARIRGLFLMAYSNQFNSLLLTTSNKSEVLVGYCTLYGDMNGGLGPIGDVYKTDVYKLCKFLNSGKQVVIPENIITKPPSAELRPDQKDTDSLPDYDILDDILMKFESSKSIDEIVSDGYDLSIVNKVKNLMNGARFKQRFLAPIIKVDI